MHPLRQHARILTASLVGTAVEFYDFYIYATAAALVFGPLFFPSSDPTTQVMLSFMSFGIAFFARPVGAIAFGHFGDRIGRKSTLVASLLLMGGSTLLIAFLPTYAMVGWVAPALLCVLRFGQGFGLGGEWGGAALLAVENAPPGWTARFGAAPQLGAPLGFLAANGLFLLLGLWLTDADFNAWGWRLPFLFSAVLVIIGLWVRLKIGETPAFQEALDKAPPHAVPLWELRRHLGPLLAGSAGVIACFAIFYLATAYALAQGTTTFGYNRETFLAVQLGANTFLALGIVLAAFHADRTSPGRTLLLGALATVALGVAFGPGLSSGSLPTIFVTLASALLVMGFVYGPLGSWLPTLFPVGVRYSGISVAFNAGGIVGGALTPLAAQWLSGQGMGAQAGLLLSLAGLITLVGVAAAKPKA
ncbi:MFS transporter [Novosphingobium ginsenosidimutans]|uniref:MHS family MFS transporter n=1 Tax=Novosphingobium ginsenosidimutans TaxID=1176536 RepID=A0A5B8RZL6_9SPHN|nr:MFS transporter [Novosphingobium ginsenosidimutans]QEA14663.1 MHS family MFS transporter [Novosphingobium ginsenosidimutans]